MNVTDPIADMLTRIRNATMARHQVVDIPFSGIKQSIAAILQSEGLIRNYEIVGTGPKAAIRVTLKYIGRDPVMTHLKRISRPGLRVYRGYTEIPRVRGGLGVIIVSTPRGVITGKDARRDHVGGEVLCEVW